MKKNNPNYALYLGVAGFIAGIILSFSDNLVIGIAGAVGSAYVVYCSVQKRSAS
jgi:hypothetical protein